MAITTASVWLWRPAVYAVERCGVSMVDLQSVGGNFRCNSFSC